MEFVSRIFSSTVGPVISRLVTSLVRTAVFGFAAAIFFLGLLAFLATAGFLWLRTRFPSDEAALLMAGVMLVLALLCILPLVLGGRRRPPPPAAQAARAAEEVVPVVQLLKAAGLHGEAAGLLAGAQLANRVRPIYLVAAAVIVGVILGRKINLRSK
jgi:hypothetical protein